MKPFFTEADCDISDFLGIDGLSHNGGISLAKANFLLEERGEIVSCRFNDLGLIQAHQPSDSSPYYNALLINLTEIEQDSAEKVLEDFIEKCQGVVYEKNSFTRLELGELYDRAKALLEGK